MGSSTKIEWSDATWNPVGGCSIKSKGCTNCYAQRMAGTRLANHPLYAGTTSPSKAGPVFNGRLTVAPDDHSVWTWPLRWRGPKVPRRGPGARPMVFVGDMSDLFHEDRPDEVIDRVFAVMALARHIDFQVLTKRPERMRDYLHTRAGDWLLRWPEAVPVAAWHISQYEAVSRLGANGPEAQRMYRAPPVNFPLPNVWLGVSAEDQPTADERREPMRELAAGGWVTFVSYEPALGPVDWTGWEFLRQIISGGESGPKARLSHPDWHRATRDFCVPRDIAYFLKQWGEWVPICALGESDDLYFPAPASYPDASRRCRHANLVMHADGAIFDRGEAGTYHTSTAGAWNAGGRPTLMFRVAKARAGRLLDGRTWDQFPEVRHD